MIVEAVTPSVIASASKLDLSMATPRHRSPAAVENGQASALFPFRCGCGSAVPFPPKNRQRGKCLRQVRDEGDPPHLGPEPQSGARHWFSLGIHARESAMKALGVVILLAASGLALAACTAAQQRATGAVVGGAAAGPQGAALGATAGPRIISRM